MRASAVVVVLCAGVSGCASLAGIDPPAAPVGVSAGATPSRPSPLEVFADADPRALTDFREALAPHGAWAEDAALGTVWIPSREALGDGAAPFVPYATAGRWTHDGAEPVWVSDYPWGWVTFHYGRWARTGDAWAWVPGRRYAGAWVDWRADEAGRWIGWAPTPPSLAWHDGDAARVAEDASAPYVYVPGAELYEEHLAGRLVALPDLLHAAAASHVVGAPPGAGAPRPPAVDAGLQRAWLLARPATAAASGMRSSRSPRARLSTYVAGAPRYVRATP